ncbi:uncharacterized oxidoreductase YjmC [Aplysia californica]|uniref:Uncharacterized oxidoreductase YjmC n=1 Tax=Aplysia californica TaxID=6500 RepID=A0ABM1W5C2_APLCA|nr:uncharacterized oxidoreductase YjmC [Aplysia californica]
MSSSSDADTDTTVIVPVENLRAFTERVIVKAGAKPAHAEALAELIVAADHRGHFSHGLNRLDYYVDDIARGVNAVDKEPEITKQGPSTALVNGNNCIGPVVGKMCIDLAIEKAKSSGVGWVCASGSNHFGIAGWYSIRAMQQGLIGMAFCNTSPNMVHPRGKERVLGTNPISVAAKGEQGDEFVLDMATTAVAQGKVEIKDRLGQQIPVGWGMDANGKLSTDTKEILYSGGLCPLGGAEETSGYKGFGLGMMVELFCGILSGSNFGTGVRKWTNTGFESEANLGQCFVAIDPSAFAPGFEGRLSELVKMVKTSEPAEGQTDLLVAGDPERAHIELCERLGGIPYHRKQIDFADFVADKYSVDRLVTS